MVKTDFSGDFLNTTNAQKGDIVEVTGEGETTSIDIKGKKPGEMKSKIVYNIPVSINGEHKIWTPSNDDGRLWTIAHGSDTVNWIGKKGTVDHIKYKSYGEQKTAVSIEPIK